MKRFLNNVKWECDFAVASNMYLVFLLIFFSRLSHPYFFALLALVIAYALVSRDFAKHSFFWLLVTLSILPGFWFKFYFAGNHVFLIIYLSILFMIANYFSEVREKIAAINAKVLLGSIMGFAVLQKLMSESFMSGSSLAFLNTFGGFFTHLQRFFPKNQALIADNLKRLEDQTSSLEGLSTTTEFSPIHWGLDIDTNLLVSIILGTELLFVVLLFVKNQYLRNGFFIIFIATLIVVRIETGFASLLCILLFLQAQKDHLIFRLSYVVIFSVFISFILNKLGVF